MEALLPLNFESCPRFTLPLQGEDVAHNQVIHLLSTPSRWLQRNGHVMTQVSTDLRSPSLVPVPGQDYKKWVETLGGRLRT